MVVPQGNNACTILNCRTEFDRLRIEKDSLGQQLEKEQKALAEKNFEINKCQIDRERYSKKFEKLEERLDEKV